MHTTPAWRTRTRKRIPSTPSTARVWLGAFAFTLAVVIAAGAYVLIVMQTDDALTVVALSAAVILALSAGLVAATEAWRLLLTPGACLATVVSVLGLAVLVWLLAFNRDLFTCWSCAAAQGHDPPPNSAVFLVGAFFLTALTWVAAVAIGGAVAIMRLIRRRMTA